jgi:hypothetical protein
MGESPTETQVKALQDDRIEVAKLEKALALANVAIQTLTMRGVVVEVDIHRYASQGVIQPLIAYRAMRPITPI